MASYFETLAVKPTTYRGSETNNLQREDWKMHVRSGF